VKRVWVLSLFLIRNLLRSLLGLAPLATMLGAYTVTFFYQGQKVDYFASVGGFDLALVCVVSTLVMSAQAGRPVIYPLLARLPRRADLLASVVISSLAISLVMALLFTALAIVQRTASVTALEFLMILPRWLALFALAAALSLHLGRLAGAGPRLAIVLVLILVLAASDQQLAWQRSGLHWLLDGAALLASPVIANLMIAVHGTEPGRYALAVLLPLLAAGLLFLLAAWLFRRRDLLWTE
jgi:hypothetical protein